MRIVLLLPSIKGGAMSILKYFAIISSKEFYGINSILARISFRYKAVANRYPPFEIVCTRISPAKSYKSKKKY